MIGWLGKVHFFISRMEFNKLSAVYASKRSLTVFDEFPSRKEILLHRRNLFCRYRGRSGVKWGSKSRRVWGKRGS